MFKVLYIFSQETKFFSSDEVILIFPILFVYASKNLDAKGVFEWMMEKPNDWIGKK